MHFPNQQWQQNYGGYNYNQQTAVNFLNGGTLPAQAATPNFYAHEPHNPYDFQALTAAPAPLAPTTYFSPNFQQSELLSHQPPQPLQMQQPEQSTQAFHGFAQQPPYAPHMPSQQISPSQQLMQSQQQSAVKCFDPPLLNDFANQSRDVITINFYYKPASILPSEAQLLEPLQFRLSQVPPAFGPLRFDNYKAYSLHQVRANLIQLTNQFPAYTFSASVFYISNPIKGRSSVTPEYQNLTLSTHFTDGEEVGKSGYRTNPNSFNKLANQYRTSQFC